jgi:hypothetical protein
VEETAMMKPLILLGTGIVSFLLVFSFTAKDEIAAEVAVRLDDKFVSQCVARLGPSMPDPSRASDVCTCMKADFAARGYALTDAFGEHRDEMQSITRSCAALYS